MELLVDFHSKCSLHWLTLIFSVERMTLILNFSYKSKSSFIDCHFCFLHQHVISFVVLKVKYILVKFIFTERKCWSQKIDIFIKVFLFGNLHLCAHQKHESTNLWIFCFHICKSSSFSCIHGFLFGKTIEGPHQSNSVACNKIIEIHVLSSEIFEYILWGSFW